uniref:Uncharacterized protein n=1 Tax=Kalanchoe fedtschenkoi TaxID=63787 RepID=A0A7N0VJL3_KALFE
MAAAMASSMSLLNPRCATHKPLLTPSSPPSRLVTSSKLAPPATKATPSLTPASSAAIAGAVFATLSSCDAAFAAQQIADLAEAGSDNRGTLLLLVVAPAIGWVLFNILQPALNQINRMRSSKGVIAGLGLGGLIALSGTREASAAVGEMGSLAAAAEAAASDNRGTLLLLVVAPAIGWVLFNILQPALNQLNRMRSE